MTESYRILKTIWIGATFKLIHGPQQLVIQDFQTGNLWILYARTSETTEWIDTNIQFTGAGIVRFEAIEQVEYKIEGGAVGAEAFVIPVFGGVSPFGVQEVT